MATSIIFQCQFTDGFCFYRSKDGKFRGLCKNAIDSLFGVSHPYTIEENPLFELRAYNKKPKGKHIRVEHRGYGNIYINENRYYLTDSSWGDLYNDMPPVFYVRLFPIKDKK